MWLDVELIEEIHKLIASMDIPGNLGKIVDHIGKEVKNSVTSKGIWTITGPVTVSEMWSRFSADTSKTYLVKDIVCADSLCISIGMAKELGPFIRIANTLSNAFICQIDQLVVLWMMLTACLINRDFVNTGLEMLKIRNEIVEKKKKEKESGKKYVK